MPASDKPKMSDAELDRLLELEAKATNGPWVWDKRIRTWGLYQEEHEPNCHAQDAGIVRLTPLCMDDNKETNPNNYWEGSPEQIANAELIAAARNALRPLVLELRAEREKNAGLCREVGQLEDMRESMREWVEGELKFFDALPPASEHFTIPQIVCAALRTLTDRINSLESAHAALAASAERLGVLAFTVTQVLTHDMLRWGHKADHAKILSVIDGALEFEAKEEPPADADSLFIVRELMSRLAIAPPAAPTTDENVLLRAIYEAAKASCDGFISTGDAITILRKHGLLPAAKETPDVTAT